MKEVFDLSYDDLKTELTAIVQKRYKDGMKLNDIRAALRAVDLMAEQYGAIEILEIAKDMAGPHRLALAELAELRGLIEILSSAIIAMAEDGWLYFGEEGMDEAQTKLHAAYLMVKPI